MKVAIVHYWLVGMRGGEKVVEALCRMYPDADVFTHVIVPERISETILRHKIKTTFINGLPFASKLYQKYLPLMPMALEQLDLRAYDLVISSESGPAKGVLVQPGSLHVCYCHSPMRYVWNMYQEYRNRAGFITRQLMPLFSHYLRNWDAISATRVDHFVANSENVAKRIRRYYRRDSTVIHPPVDVDGFRNTAPDPSLGEFYLMAGELVAYKRPELAIDAFARLGKRLVIIGGGEMLSKLTKAAPSNISLLGPQSGESLRRHYASCQALVFPGEEDFGIVPVEAMASGRPVIAFASGGALETVIEGKTGTFFRNQTVEDLLEAEERLCRMGLVATDISAHAEEFAESVFETKMGEQIEALLAARD